METALAIPIGMLIGPFVVIGALRWWSLIPIGASVVLLHFASRRRTKTYWIGFAVFCVAAFFGLGVLYSMVDTTEISGPAFFDLGFLMMGSLGWILDLLLIGIAASFLARRERAQT